MVSKCRYYYPNVVRGVGQKTIVTVCYSQSPGREPCHMMLGHTMLGHNAWPHHAEPLHTEQGKYQGLSRDLEQERNMGKCFRVSVAVINTVTKNISERQSFISVYRLQSIIQGSKNRNLGQGLKQKLWKNAAHSSGLLSYHFRHPRPSCLGITPPMVDRVLYISWQLRKGHTDLATGQSNGGNFLIEVPSSWVCQIDNWYYDTILSLCVVGWTCNPSSPSKGFL